MSILLPRDIPYHVPFWSHSPLIRGHHTEVEQAQSPDLPEPLPHPLTPVYFP